MLLCRAEREHVPQQYLLGPPLGNYRHSCESNKQVGSLLGEEKRPWRVQSKENRVRWFGVAQVGSAWAGRGKHGGLGYGIVILYPG